MANNESIGDDLQHGPGRLMTTRPSIGLSNKSIKYDNLNGIFADEHSRTNDKSNTVMAADEIVK